MSSCGCSESFVQNGGGARMDTKTVVELYKQAQKYKIKGRSSMKKAQLISAIRAKQMEIGESIRKRGKK